MISFEFTPDQTAFQKTLADFSRKVLLPVYRDRASSTEFPFDVLRQLGELGVLGIGLPEEFGGTGAEDPVTLGLATETLAYGDVNVASAPVQVGLIGSQLVHRTEEVQQRYLPAMIEGRENVAIALTEPGSGSDAGGLTSIARPVKDGWRLTGERTAISWAMHSSAALVYAREPGTTGARGVSCYLVPLDGDKVTVHHMPGMGCLPLGWGSIHLDDVFVPTSHLIGEPGRGFHAVMSHFDFSRAALGLCYRALWLREQGKPHTSLASMSKWWPPTIAKGAIEAAMRIHGNLGYATEFPLQQRFRDVMAYLVADGTAEIQKRVIAKDILARKRTSF